MQIERKWKRVLKALHQFMHDYPLNELQHEEADTENKRISLSASRAHARKLCEKSTVIRVVIAAC